MLQGDSQKVSREHRLSQVPGSTMYRPWAEGSAGIFTQAEEGRESKRSQKTGMQGQMG